MNFLITILMHAHVLVAHAQSTFTASSLPTSATTSAANNLATMSFSGTASNLSFRSIVSSVISFLDHVLMPLLVALGVIYFIVNIIYYLYNMDNEAKRTEFRKYTINAILALFILLSLWGIIGLATTTLFNHGPVVPQLPTDDTGGTCAPQ